MKCNLCGSLSKTTQIITVLPKAKAQIGVDSTTIRCLPTTITFTNRSTGFNVNVTWDFGDRTPLISGNAPVVSHKYQSPSTKQVYTVRLTVNNDCGSYSDSVQVTVFPKEVIPSFTVSKNPISPGDNVIFTDASTPVPGHVKWEIDGHLLEGKIVSYSQFTKPNSRYTIKMTAYPVCGGFATREQSITTGPIPNDDFKVPSLNCLSKPVSITNASDTRLRFQWNFGNGSPIDSIFYSPTYIYDGIGQI